MIHNFRHVTLPDVNLINVKLKANSFYTFFDITENIVLVFLLLTLNIFYTFF